MRTRGQRMLLRGGVALIAGLLLPSLALASPFIFVGPRPNGMGGAGVSATEDAHAIYWNPAGLTQRDGFDIWISGSVRGAVDQNLEDAVDSIRGIIKNGNLSPESIARLESLVSSLEDNTGAGTNGAGGIFAKYTWDENAVGLSFYDGFNGTASIPVIDPTISIIEGKLFNASVVALTGLEGRQIAAAYARSFMDNTASIGVTVSALQAVAYLDQTLIRRGNVGFDFSGLSQTKEEWQPSVDVGGTWNPTSYLRFSMVGKYLNRPRFGFIPLGEGKIEGVPDFVPPDVVDQIRARLRAAQPRIELAPQGRASVAVFPMEGMTLTSDVDVTPNPTLINGANSQIMSVGGEQLFLERLLAARLGVYYDFELPNADPVPTIGLGVEVIGIGFGISGAYDFDESAGALSVGFGYTM